jgi:hypothetical protein
MPFLPTQTTIVRGKECPKKKLNRWLFWKRYLSTSMIWTFNWYYRGEINFYNFKYWTPWAKQIIWFCVVDELSNEVKYNMHSELTNEFMLKCVSLYQRITSSRHWRAPLGSSFKQTEDSATTKINTVVWQRMMPILANPPRIYTQGTKNGHKVSDGRELLYISPILVNPVCYSSTAVDR